MISTPRTWLVATAGRFSARCDCTWRSDSTDRADQAVAAADAHQAESGHRRGGDLDRPEVRTGDWVTQMAEASTTPAAELPAPLQMAAALASAGPNDDVRVLATAAVAERLRRYHPSCGWIHGWDDWCPTASESPRGRLLRVLIGQPADRLAAVHELGEWLDEQEREAVVAARLARTSWKDIGAAYGGLSRQGAHNRWGAMVATLETTGLLAAPAEAAPPAPPLVPEWADLRSAVTWCRWCGQRLAMFSGQPGWSHSTPGSLDVRADDFRPAAELDAACTGPEPWPARQSWPDDPPSPEDRPAPGQPFTAGDRVRPASPAVRVGSVDGQRRPTEGTVRGHHERHIRVQWDDRTSDDLYEPSDLEHLS